MAAAGIIGTMRSAFSAPASSSSGALDGLKVIGVFEVASRARAVALIEADAYHQAHPRAYGLLVRGKALPPYEVLM